jgi:BASS family bile acid:Na+ symporter
MILQLAGVTIFLLMLTIGVNRSWSDIVSIWQTPDRLIRLLLAAIVLVPLLAVLLFLLFDLSPPVATGLAILASTPGAPLTTLRSKMAGANVTYASSLQLTLAFLAIIVTPLTLALFDILFDSVTERATIFHVARQVAMVTFLPVVIGLLLQRFTPGLVEAIRKPLNWLANGLFVVLVLVAVVMFAISAELRGMLAIGWPALGAIIIMVAGSLAFGHALGRGPQDERAAVAISSVARNVGLAVFLTGVTETGQASVPTIVAYLIVGVVISVPYAAWSKRKIASQTQ